MFYKALPENRPWVANADTERAPFSLRTFVA